jgi:hypothetical protein
MPGSAVLRMVETGASEIYAAPDTHARQGGVPT